MKTKFYYRALVRDGKSELIEKFANAGYSRAIQYLKRIERHKIKKDLPSQLGMGRRLLSPEGERVNAMGRVLPVRRRTIRPAQSNN